MNGVDRPVDALLADRPGGASCWALRPRVTLLGVKWPQVHILSARPAPVPPLWKSVMVADVNA